MKPKVFVSYSRSDAAFAEKLRLELKRAELSAWLDVDDLKPGTEWQPRLEEALRTASAVVVCLSPKSANSAYVTFEWSYAMGAGVKVFPVIVKETALPPWLSRIQWIDLSGKNPPWIHLIKALKTVPRSRRIERRISEIAHRKAAPGNLKSLKQRSGPKLSAKFELTNGKPVKIGDEYSIGLTVKDAPAGTKSVTYELHDDTFREPRFSIDDTEKDFECWISSYGDVKISARGESGHRSWKSEEWLSRALRRGHGSRPSDEIKKALKNLERY